MPRSVEIDPQLPYIQVHRSVAQKAALLAPHLGVTYQHVRGGLDCFWEALADRRLLASGKPVILTAVACRARLKLAFGVEVDPELLAAVGFLDPEGDGYRVRGMSRYLDAEQKRQNASHAKSTVSVPEVHLGNTSGVPEEQKPPPKRGKRSKSVPEEHLNPTEARGERREVRDERREGKGEVETRPFPFADRRASDSPLRKPVESPHQALIKALTDEFLRQRGAEYDFGGWDAKSVANLLEKHTATEIERRWGLALSNRAFPTVSSIPELERNFNHFAGTGPPKRDRLERGVVQAEDIDWNQPKTGSDPF